MSKFAYLIMAHNDAYCFSKLIDLLDDKRNDIFVHIDRKSDICPFQEVKPKYSHIYYTDRVDVRWGDVSQIEAELTLFKAAIAHKAYDYYHLLSGVDLPLKSQDEMHSFFDDHRGCEFVGITPHSIEAKKRCSYYYALTRHTKQPYRWERGIIKSIRIICVGLQKLVGFRRNKNTTFYMGPNWVSISHGLCQYIVNHADEILQTYGYCWCPDEVFIPTLVMNSPFKGKQYKKEQFASSVRKIDFERGKPWVWRLEDYNELMSSDCMFARKFSSNVDKNIIDKIYKTIKGENEDSILPTK